MAHHVEHLHSAEAVDEAIFREAGTERLVVVRYGRGEHAHCVRVDAAWPPPPSASALYAVDIEEVQDFNAMYELHERPCTVMFFYENCYVDVRGPRCRDDIVWAAYGGDEFAGLVRAVHERAKAGHRLVVLGYELLAV